MKVTVLGGCGAWPAAGQACSGYLVEHAGFRLVLDLGYATLPRLLGHALPEQIDAVLISHGHPDHCVDVNPLLRARALRDDPSPALPIFALPGALSAVLALDRKEMLADAYALREVTAGARFDVGPFRVGTWLLPHSVPNVGFRLSTGDRVVAYTGDTGPSHDVVELARDADLLIADATYPEHVPADSAAYLGSAVLAGRQATQAGAARLVLTHLMPGTDAGLALRAASGTFTGPTEVAAAGLIVDLD